MSKYIEVLRVEHEIYENDLVFAGPYGVSGIVESDDWDVNGRHKNSLTHPSPQSDKKLKQIFGDKLNLSPYYCGFESISQLNNWFSSRDLNLLKSLDFTIRKYKVSKKNVLFGDKQVLFVPTKKGLNYE